MENERSMINDQLSIINAPLKGGRNEAADEVLDGTVWIAKGKWGDLSRTGKWYWGRGRVEQRVVGQVVIGRWNVLPSNWGF